VGTDKYQTILRAAGFTGDAPPAARTPELVRAWAWRVTPVLAGSGTVAGRSAEAHLFDARGYRSSSWAAQVTVKAPVSGAVRLTPRPMVGLVLSMWQMWFPLNWLLLAMMWCGLWLLMLPGLMFFTSIARRALERDGWQPVEVPGAPLLFRLLFVVRAKDVAAVPAICTPAMIEALRTAPFYGQVITGPGEVRIETAFPYGRPGLFEKFLTQVTPRLLGALQLPPP